MAEKGSYEANRLRMVEEQFVRRDITDKRVLDAMRKVPRHIFVPEEHRHLAYSDCPLPIGQNQTISQPYIVALMTQMLALKGDEVVLEIGTGSGYQAAVLSLVAKEVYTIERYEILAQRALESIKQLDVKNVTVQVGDGTLGWPEHAPYDAILATAAAPNVPQPLLDQLADGGRLVIPVGGRIGQYLESWFREGDKFRHEQTVAVAFVPLLGKHGWKDNAWDWL
ncbi:MAG: protein-L-isoaspartate(D-aspartate) O-methyltransferase [Chloroflexota bacterium]|nr:MAG: protein-L-isoaspartate(D-aspartate) O-methyltransferase [Chloroflexota bacterium]UCF28434.1 MAG: protein-L-isoaspartate(D-aspartate) O-methyltransferase [Chloroflexota bacterium]